MDFDTLGQVWHPGTWDPLPFSSLISFYALDLWINNQWIGLGLRIWRLCLMEEFYLSTCFHFHQHATSPSHRTTTTQRQRLLHGSAFCVISEYPCLSPRSASRGPMTRLEKTKARVAQKATFKVSPESGSRVNFSQ